MKKTLLSIMLFVGVMLCSPSCMKEYLSMDEVPGDLIRFSTENMTAEVVTKTAETTMSTLQTNGFNVSATTGSAGSETSAWNSVAFTKNGDLYTGNKFWPASNPNYHFYASNVALTHNSAGCTVAANANTDVVCAYLGTTTYKNTNNLTFEHIFARLCRIDVVAETGYDISGISVRMTPKTSGTYNLRTGAGQTDGTGWSSVSAGSQQTVATAKGANNNDIYTVPGTYSFTVTWTATNSSGSVTYTNQVVNLPLKGGKTNNVSLVLGGGVNFGIDLQDYYQYDYRDNLDYLTFYCDEAGTIGWKCSNASIARTIQYSKNFGASWTNLTSTTSGATVSVNAGDIVWFKGSNTEYATSSSNYNQFTLSNKAHVYGNVNSLTGNNTSVSAYCFYMLFFDCSNLYTYEHKKIILPATTLADSCYGSMFSNCTSLTVAPELPATTLSDSCYGSMFSGCTSLTVAPELPATTLADFCYEGMFSGCTSLTTAPELPATTLASGCYNFMFFECTSLTVAPELPATTLAEYCYNFMFSDCTSLTVAPELPATTLAENCYEGMFGYCTSLNYIKALFTTDPSSGYYTTGWVSGVASWGIFVKSSDATWDEVGDDGVPTGWTVVKTPLYLPGEFSVSSTKKVKFAKGNLQAIIGGGPTNTYNYSASSWKFAGHQYDFIGNAAGNKSFAVGTTVDLFGWVGASASYDSYGLCTTANNAYYGTSASDALKTDWGSVPGVVSSLGPGWHTLTITEWNYLFTERANASSLYGQCQITTASGTVTGMLILPDNWTKPSNCTVTPGTGAFDRVTYSATAASGASNAWCDMEAAGAVFLPVAGFRNRVSVYDVGSSGMYWSSSVGNANYAYTVYFDGGNLYPQYIFQRYLGFSVRLVKEAN